MPLHNPLLRPLPLVIALQAALLGHAHAAPGGFTVITGSTVSTRQELIDDAVVQEGGTLSVAGSNEAVKVLGGTSTLDNYGSIRQTGTGRAIDANANGMQVTITNHAGAVIDAVGNVAIRLNKTDGHYVIDNQGTISQSGTRVGGERAIKADDNFANAVQIINGSSSNSAAVISSTGNDALRIGSNVTLTNYGSITSTGAVNTSCPDYMPTCTDDDFSAADGVAIQDARSNVVILNHGSISGPRHGIDGGNPLSAVADSNLFGLEQLVVTAIGPNGVTFDKTVDGVTSSGIHILNPVVINYEGGQITGHNGSGVGFDGHGVVFNHGTITGDYAGAGNVFDHQGLSTTSSNGDGDGVDIDGMAYIENHGVIQGLGAGGSDSGGNANGADGIAAGGGTIINHAGARIFGQAKGILIDDGASGSSPTVRGTADANGGVAYIRNAGEIIGADDVAIGLVGNFDDRLLNLAGGVIRGGADATRVDQNNSNTAAAAVQMGAGNDTLLNAGLIEGENGLAVDLGDGDDLLTVLGSGQFIGLVDGGAGNDIVELDDSLGGQFGNSSNFELLRVSQGAWTVSGDDFSFGAVVLSGASLRNAGIIRGEVLVGSGGAFGGGQVDGDLDLAGGSSLLLDIAADGSHNPTLVNGRAFITDSTLHVVAGAGDYPRQSQYSVLQADGGIDGRFASVSSNFAFLTPTLSYDDNSVTLDMLRNDQAFADVAQSGNGRNVADSLQSQGSGELYQALVTSSEAEASKALEQLAASSNASAASVNQASTAQIGGAMLGAMQQLGGSSNLQAALLREDAPQLAATGVPQEARNLTDSRAAGRLWVQGLGSHGRIDGNAGVADVSQDTQGALLGADWSLGSAWRLGVLGGYSRSDVDAGRGASSDIDSLHLGLYAVHQSGPLALRLGAAYSQHDNSSTRRVEFSGFSDRLRSDFDADSQQAFAELGYQLTAGRLLAEPFAAIGYQRYSHEAYSEKGGAAALRVEEQDQDNLTSTLGVRLAHLGTLDNGMSLTPRLSVGWRHVYGDIDSSAQQSFLSGGSAFSVEGTALDRNSLLLQAGVDLGISTTQSVGLGYSGEMGSDAQNHGLVAQWQLRF